jgi:hypothetical protein
MPAKQIVTAKHSKMIRNNGEVAPRNPSSGIEMKRAIIIFFIEIKNKRKKIKFLCSAKTMVLKASKGFSINFRIVVHRSIFTVLSLRYDLQFSHIFW